MTRLLANPWTLVGLIALSVAATAIANGLVAKVRPTTATSERKLARIRADLLWVGLLFLASLVAARYIERVASALLGYGVFAVLAVLLSVVRAALYRRAQEQRLADVGTETKTARTQYRFVILAVTTVLALSAVPIGASDLFREPYLPVWRTINRTIDRLHYTYNPSGGGIEPRFPPWHNPGDAGLRYSDVSLTTADGVRLAAWYVPAETTDAGTVLLAHGLYDSKWTMLRLVPWLHRAGYNVVLWDFRGHGGSDRRPTTLGREEALDVQAVLDWLQARGTGDRVVGLGMSLGAAALLNTAVQDDRLDGLVLDSLFAEWKDVDYARGYRLPPEWLVPNVPDPVGLIRLVHVPVLIIHGSADNLTHVDHAYRLYRAGNEPKSLWVNDSGHAWSAWTYPQLYQQKVLAFLREALARAGQ